MIRVIMKLYKDYPLLWKLLLLAVQAFILFCVVLFLVQRWIVFPVALAGQTYGIPITSQISGVSIVYVTTSDGERLVGYWRKPSEGAGVVVTFHGNASSPLPHVERFAAAPWSGGGWGVLALAYRGYPGSTGRPTQEGLLIDGEAALSFVRENAPEAPVLLHGHSLGSAVAIALASKHDVAGLFLDAPFTSLVDVSVQRLPVLPRLLMRDRFPSLEWARTVKAPALIVHGEADAIVPSWMGERIAMAVPTAKFVGIPFADHVSGLGMRDALAEEMFRPAKPEPEEDETVDDETDLDGATPSVGKVSGTTDKTR